MRWGASVGNLLDSGPAPVLRRTPEHTWSPSWMYKSATTFLRRQGNIKERSRTVTQSWNAPPNRSPLNGVPSWLSHPPTYGHISTGFCMDHEPVERHTREQEFCRHAHAHSVRSSSMFWSLQEPMRTVHAPSCRISRRGLAVAWASMAASRPRSAGGSIFFPNFEGLNLGDVGRWG